MNRDKNSSAWFSLSVIAILLICFTCMSICLSLPWPSKENSIAFNFDFAEEQESSDAKKNVDEDPSNLFFLDFQKFRLIKNTINIIETHTVFLIPRVFYEIQILPPEFQKG